MGFYNPSSCTPEEKTYLGLALHQVRQWRNWYEYEEMASEAILGAFSAVAECSGEAGWLRGVAVRGAQSAVSNYWRHRGRLKRTAEVVSLQALVETNHEPVAPDFVPGVLDRIDWLAALRSCCTVEQQRYLYRFYFLGETYQEIAQAESVARKRVDNQIYLALQKLRAELTRDRS